MFFVGNFKFNKERLFMGQEIYTDFFTENDSIKFKDAVRQETLQLKKYFDENSFCDEATNVWA